MPGGMIEVPLLGIFFERMSVKTLKIILFLVKSSPSKQSVPLILAISAAFMDGELTPIFVLESYNGFG